MATTNHPLLLATAAAHGLLAVGHTLKGFEQFQHPSLKALPTILRGALKNGWYEGSGFMIIVSILNYKWSQTGLVDIYDKSVAGVLATILLGAAANYWQTGDKTGGVTLTVVSMLQILAAKGASS